MKKKIYAFIFVIAVLGVSALTGAANANAESAADNILQIQPWSDLTINGQSSFSDNEVVGWLDTVNTGGCSSERRLQISEAINNGYDYYLVQVVTGTVLLYIDEQNTGIENAQFDLENRSLITTGSVGATQITFMNYTGSFRYQCDAGLGAFPLSLENGDYKLVSYRGFTIEYPTGYNGQILNPEQGPSVPVDYVPQFWISQGRDWNVKIHDKNFNTFDKNPFLCGDEFAPILYYEIWDRTQEDEVLLHTGHHSATVEINYQFEKVEQKKDYRIIGWYDCGVEGELTFSESNFADFSIKKDGNLYIIGLETCVQEEFPYLNWESCTSGINSMLSILTFNAVNPSDSNLGTVVNNNPNSCHKLGIVGEWLHNEEQNICPAFTAEVRNIVTPFAIFILGSTVFYWVTRGKGVVVD